MDENVSVTFPLTFFEYRAAFEEPILELWFSPAKDIQKAVYKALLPWNITFENVILPVQPKNIAEWHITFNLPLLRTSVVIGVGGLTVAVTNPDWSQAVTLSALADAVSGAIKQVATARISGHSRVLAMHMTPIGTDPSAITSRFVHVNQSSVSRLGDLDNFGFSIYGRDAIWTIDVSVGFAKSLFVRLARTYKGDANFSDLVSDTAMDQKAALSLLGCVEHVNT